MSLLRFAGRALFSSYYIADGYQLLTRPDQNADQLAPAVDRIVPVVQSVLPPDTADRLPEDARTWTRIFGIAQLVGGAAYATGIGRRLGAVLLTVATLPRLLASAGNRDTSGVFAQAALLGAGVVATQDTNGRPGLAWRAEQSKRAIEARAAASTKDLQRTQKRLGKGAKVAGQMVGREIKLARTQLAKAGLQAEKGAGKVARQANRKIKDVLN